MFTKNQSIDETIILDCLEKIEKIYSDSNENTFEETEFTNYTSVMKGQLSLVLLYHELHKKSPEKSYDIKIHEILKECIENVEVNDNLSLSLFDGLSGIAFTIHIISENGLKYSKLKNSLDTLLLERLEIYLTSFDELDHLRTELGYFMYDVCYGLSGIARYLLMIQSSNTKAYKLLSIIVSKFIDITLQDEDNMYGWTSFREGLKIVDTGLAHGVTGPLCIMSMCLEEHLPIKKLDYAVEKLANWLINTFIDNESSLIIPNIVNVIEKDNRLSFSTRDAWCYGPPGISYVLRLAGLALNNEEIQEFSGKIFNGVMERDFKIQQNYSPTLCHGLSGMLVITMALNEINQNSKLIDYKEKIYEEIISFYDPKLMLGFQDINFIENNMLHENKLGMLEGTIGVLLTLLTYSNKRLLGWERLLMIK